MTETTTTKPAGLLTWCTRALGALAATVLLVAAPPAAAFHFPWDQGHDTTQSNDPNAPGPDDRPPCDDDCKKGASGSPVYTSLGHAIWRSTDMVLRGRPYIGVYRAYNSNDPVVGLFGNGWTVDFDVALYPANNSGVQQRVFKASNGKRFVYVKQADGSFLAPAGRFDTIVEGPSTVTMSSLDGGRTVFALDGRLLQRIDVNGNAVSFSYDASLRPVGISDGNGRSLTITYNGSSLVGSVADHTGRSWAYGYDANGNLVSVTDPAGGVLRYTWQAYRPSGDANTYWQLLSSTDPSGVVQVSFTYSGNQVASYTEGANRFTYTRQTSNTKLAGTVTKRDSLSATTTYTYGALGLITREVDALGGTTNYTYDANGNLTLIVDAAGRSWNNSYDSLGRTTSSGNGLGQATSFQYGGSDTRPVRITTPSGRITTLAYDAAGNLLSSTDPTGAVTRMTYSARGDVLSITNALSQGSSMTYNAAGLPLTATDGLGRTSSMAYDALGRVTSATNAAGESTLYAYDVLDRVTSATDPLGGVTLFTYDAAGRLTSVTDAKGSTTRYEYDGFGRRSAEVAPDGRRTTIAYRVDNLPSTVTWPDATTISYQYDANKRVTSETAGSETITYSYNAANQMLSATGPGGTVSFTYDAAGRIATETSNGRVSTTTRNAEGERTQLSALGSAFTYTRDGRGQVTRIAHATVGNFDFSYDALGRRTQLAYPNGASTGYSFDAAGQLAGLSLGGAYTASLAYSFDAAGRITRVAGDGPDQLISYDGFGRVVSAVQGASSYGYALDAVGNLTGGGRSYDANHRLVSDAAKTYSYDGRGNLTLEQDRATGARTAYSWNVKNQLLRVDEFPDAVATTPTRTLQFTYDPLGRRASKTDRGTTQRYVYDGDDLVGVLDGAGNVVGTNVFAGGVDEPLASFGASGSPSMLQANHQGSIVAVSSGATLAASYRYGPYGEVAAGSSADSTPFRYTAREKDTDTLYHYRARYYSTAQQRFISQDPIGVRGGLNTYAYVGGDPVNEIDPTGKCPWCIGAAFGFGIDLVSQLIENGGNWRCISLGRLAASTALGALGGGLGGKGLTGLMRGLSNSTKGQIGEALSIANNRLMGSELVATQTRSIPGMRTIVDSTWRSMSGSTYYVESKFGTSGLTAAQRAAQAAMGDAYHVERWGYPFFERVGAYGGGAAAGAAASTAQGGDCGCN